MEKQYPIVKRKHKYYKCECGTEMKVTNTLNTDRYGVLEYMRCTTCDDKMVARDNKLIGIAA